MATLNFHSKQGFEGEIAQPSCANVNLKRFTEDRKLLNDLGDDNLVLVLSFLSPSDVGQCACVSRRWRSLCKDDSKVWLQMCERRWGRRTCVKRWGKGCVCFRVLHGVLLRWESLIGFWRGIGDKGRGCLVEFEWGAHFIKGFKVLPAAKGSYGVCKVPFVWIGMSEDGNNLCFMDRCAYKNPISSVNESMEELGYASASKQDSSDKLGFANLGFDKLGLDGSADFKQCSFDKLGFDCSSEAASALGLATVNVHFIGASHLLMEEAQPQKLGGKRLSLAEAATVTSFGSSSEHICDSSPSRGDGLDICMSGCSPPGSFSYEMYHFLASKVSSSGNDRAERRRLRRDRVRALSQGKPLPEPEYFVKVPQCIPTETKPLQGLWKGLCHCMNLDFILLSYDEQGGVVCRKIKECSGIASGGPIYWTATPPICRNVPLSCEEQEIFVTRVHIKPKYPNKVAGALERGNVTFTDCGENFMPEEVVGMLHVTPDRDHCCSLSSVTTEQCQEGRIWLYESGRFGFGMLHNHFITDFRPLTSSGCLLDVVDK